MKKKIFFYLMLIIGMFVFVACGGSDKTETNQNKDTLIIAQGADAKSLDPHNTNDQPSARVLVQIYEPLVELNDKAEPVPVLAETWERPDDKTLILHLRKGVKFHNGEEMKASDVKFSLDRSRKSPKVASILSAISNVVVVDPYTVKIETKKPFAPIFNHLAHPAASILSEKAVKEAGATYGQHPVGTGPFKFVSWQSGDRINLEAFQNYWRESSPIKHLVFRNIVEETSRTIGLETGELDVIYDIFGMDKNKLKEDPNFKFIEEISASITYLGFNMEKAPLDNLKVREAIAYAIDQKALIDTAYLGGAMVADSIIPPSILGYFKVMPFEQNIEKSKQLLKEAGYENGLKIKLWINDNPVRRDLAVIIQDQLKQVGIDVAIETLEWGAYLDRTAAGEHDLFLLGWGTVTRDPDYGIAELVSTETMGAPGNRSFYSNKKVDELLEKGKVELNIEKRKEIYKQIQEILRKDIPMYIICYPTQNIVTKKNIEGIKVSPAGHHKIYGATIK